MQVWDKSVGNCPSLLLIKIIKIKKHVTHETRTDGRINHEKYVGDNENYNVNNHVNDHAYKEYSLVGMRFEEIF